MHVSRMVAAYALVVIFGACGSVVSSKPDASTDAPAVDAAPDGTQQPFMPTQLSGLVLWLDANQNVVSSQSKVSTWMDRSGRNNNAAQSVAALQPSVVTGVVNGLPVIRFASTVLQVTDSATLQWAADDFALLVVAGYKNASPGYGMILGKQETPYPYAGPALWGNYNVPSHNTVIALQADGSGNQYAVSAGAKNDGVIRLYTARRVGTTLEVRVNGNVQGTVTATSVNVSASGRPLYIGGNLGTGSLSQAIDGDIAEIVAVHGALSSADLTKLEAYLKMKYGLP